MSGKKKQYRRKNARKRGGARSNADRVLAPGAAAVTTSAFGRSKCSYSLACWDAKHPHHLPLPRATGPYTVIRVTRRFSSSDAVNIFGTFYKGSQLDNICCVSSLNETNPMNDPNNMRFQSIDLGNVGAAATLVPSAFSLQIMNPNPLQTTHGTIYAGVMNTQAALANRSDHWSVWADKFVEFQAPRILTAPKLAMRGVQINSYPLNMSVLADFKPIVTGPASGTTTWGGSNSDLEPAGFAPIVVFNATAEDLESSRPQLEFLVTTEYRVRFDLDNVASASHQQHPVAPDHVWADLMSRASSLGNGVIDIVEGVANFGQMAYNGYKSLNKIRAITGHAAPLALTV